jgi:hypothetical protein
MNFKKMYYDFKAKVILKLIGDMPVIVNCTIYDDILEFNFGETVVSKPCIAFNNVVKNFGVYANRYKRAHTLIIK